MMPNKRKAADKMSRPRRSTLNSGAVTIDNKRINTSGHNLRAMKGPRQSKPQDQDESDVQHDLGRNSSRAFQQAGLVDEQLEKENNISKEFIERHRNNAIAKKDVLLALAAESEGKLASVGAEVRSAIRSVCLDPTNMNMAGKNDSIHVAKWSNPLFKTTKEVLDIGYELLKSYDRTEKDGCNQKEKLPQTQWAKDEEGAKTLLRCGREYGEALAETIILPGNEARIIDVNMGRLSDDEIMAVEMFDHSRRAAGGGTWGQLAWDQIEALENVIATVPKDVETEGQN